MGLIFDGNIESLVGDFVYEGETNRAVAVHTAGMTEALQKALHGAGSGEGTVGPVAPPSAAAQPRCAAPRYNRHRMDIYEELVRLRNLGQKCALATIVQVRGSIPSYETAKLLVREDGSMMGTIGGGCVEAEVWNAAREVIETEKPQHLTFNLGQDAAYDNGLICGGQLEVFVEPCCRVPRAFIFGAGHISKSLSKVAELAGFASVVIDNRETFANRERFPRPPKFTPRSTKRCSRSCPSTKPATS